VLRNLPQWTENTSYFQFIPGQFPLFLASSSSSHSLPGFHGCAANVPPANQTLVDKIKGLVPNIPGIPSVQIPEQLCYGTMSVYRVCAALAVCWRPLSISPFYSVFNFGSMELFSFCIFYILFCLLFF
jgi:hypothetical protein